MGGKRDRVTEDVALTAVRAAVFLDPSGRRWRVVRLVAVVLVALFVAGLAYALPRIYAAPALGGRAPYPEVSAAQTTDHPPVVGQGPLVRVLHIKHEGGRLVGYDPFTGERTATLSAAEAKHAGGSAYVIQRFGYSAAAHKTISITFDDGPDPKYTPELLNVLGRAHVPATFFVTGTMAARHPEIVAREVREGHAVANHSLTHVDVSSVPAWRTHVELAITDRVLRAITGTEAAYFRLPYEGDDEKSTQATLPGLLRAQQLGYVVTSHDFDTEDWLYTAHPSKGAIPLPPLDGRNVTVLMHDGGGSGRQKTINYVKKLIPYARAHGYTFQTMPQVQPALAAHTHRISPTIWDRATLLLVEAFFAWPNQLMGLLFLFAVLSVVVVGLGNCALALIRFRRRRRTRYPSPAELTLPVSVVLAAYNEEGVIRRTLETILAADYPILEVVVVDDGSRDGTAVIVQDVAARDRRVRLVRQPNAGKAHALNRGLELARGEVIVTLDADTILTPTTIGNLVRHFALDEAGTLGGVAGVVRVGNRRRNLLTRWQALEYLTQIGVERAAQDALGAISIVPGACAAWRKDAILAVGGYSNSTLAEDCDLSLCLHRAGWRLTQDDEALAYTEAPEDVDALLAQRTRWTYGTLQSIVKHRRMLFRRRYGWLGSFVLPNYVVSIVTPLIFLPFITVMGVLAVREQGWAVVFVYFAVFMAVHLLVAAVGIAVMRERPVHLVMVPIYRLVYEPLRAYLLYTSVYLAIRGVRMGWNKLARTGAMDAGLSGTARPAAGEAVALESEKALTGSERSRS